MPFTVKEIDHRGRVIRPQEPQPKPILADGERCLVCFEYDPAAFANCTKGDCYPIYEGPEPDYSGFSVPKPLVSAYGLGTRMRAKALSLSWDQDEERERLLRRARELQTGERELVPDEAF